MKGDGFLIVFGLGAMTAAALTVLLSEAPRQRTTFHLVDSNGHVVTTRSLSGRWTLVYFGYTNCPDLCPTTIARMIEARDALGRRSRLVRPVFVSIDPARDTPERLRAYASAFSPDLVALTGAPRDLGAAERAFGVHAEPVAGGNGAIRHSEFIYLLDPSSNLVATLPGTGPAVDLAETLGRLVR